ncbi:thioredoxin Y [Carex littledalei]|uniref:Thioredoxin Y n=1 Tax=Carex littledalei TaxID=544730 RepID=A0A833VVQ5_9POAL|nr:thioredoxin Y [Carex littledalei]
MAISSSTASLNLARPIGSVLPTPKFLAVHSFQAAPHRCSPSRFPRLLAVIPRRTATRIEAKKQTFSSFDELLAQSDKPVLVDFYATWCGPCQFMVPVLEEVSEKLNDKIVVVKIDTEKYVNIASKYSIEALPTFIIFKDGKPCDRFEGALNANQLIQRIEEALQVTK